jgi:hypothetical protein
VLRLGADPLGAEPVRTTPLGAGLSKARLGLVTGPFMGTPPGKGGACQDNTWLVGIPL